MEQQNRLRWRCRRGMLELDLLLQGFMQARYARLDAVERSAFDRLLDYPDPLLLDVLMGHLAPTDKDIGHVVEKIRQSAQP